MRCEFMFLPRCDLYRHLRLAELAREDVGAAANVWLLPARLHGHLRGYGVDRMARREKREE
jgi:hypothetical protein